MYTVTNWPNRDPLGEAGAGKLINGGFNLELFLAKAEMNSLSVFLLNRSGISLFSAFSQMDGFTNTSQLYTFADNDLLNSIDILGLIGCGPSEVQDPTCIANCNIDYGQDMTAAGVTYAAAIAASVFCPPPVVGPALCISTATGIYYGAVAVLDSELAQCKANCPCVCPTN